VLVSFDPAVLNWFPSVLIPLPHQEFFDYLVQELVVEFDGITEDDILRVMGWFGRNGPEVSTGATEYEPVVATYATTAVRQLTLDVPVPEKHEAQSEIQDWLSEYHTS